MRANGIAEFSFAPDTGTLNWDFSAHGLEAVSYTIPKWSKYSDFIRAALVNGFKQKIADSGALSDATVAEKREAMHDCAENLRAEIWNAPRESGNTLLFRAACQLNPGKTPAEIKAKLEAMPAKLKRALAKLPEYRDAMDAMRPAVDDAIANAALADLMS